MHVPGIAAAPRSYMWRFRNWRFMFELNFVSALPCGGKDAAIPTLDGAATFTFATIPRPSQPVLRRTGPLLSPSQPLLRTSERLLCRTEPLLSPSQRFPGLRSLYSQVRNEYSGLRSHYFDLRNDYFGLRNRYFPGRNDSSVDAAFTRMARTAFSSELDGLDLVLPAEFMNSTDVFSDHLGHGHIVYGKNIFFKITALNDRGKHLPFLGGHLNVSWHLPGDLTGFWSHQAALWSYFRSAAFYGLLWPL